MNADLLHVSPGSVYVTYNVNVMLEKCTVTVLHALSINSQRVDKESSKFNYKLSQVAMVQCMALYPIVNVNI